MQRSFTFVLLLVVCFVCLGPLAAQDAPEMPYAARGPYPVGTYEFVVEPDSERPLPLTVWYPALNPDGAPEEVDYTYDSFFTSIDGFTQPGHALAGAAPDPASAPYPLVMISHGLAGNRYLYAYLAEHLASHGFVVFALDHNGNTAATGVDPQVRRSDFSGFIGGHALSMAFRPLDIQRLIDYAGNLTSQNGEMAGVIDTEQIAVVGHSSGGYTALAAAGGRVDFGPLGVWCRENSTNADVNSSMDYVLGCYGIVPMEQILLSIAGFDTQPGEPWPPFEVEGVDAIVPIAPGVEITPEGLADVHIPTLFIVGSVDSQISPQRVYDDYAALPSEQKGLVVLEGADHGFPHSACTPWFVEHDATPGCYFDPVWDMDRAHDLINHFTTAFLLSTLKGDAEARAALAPDAVVFPGITYQAEGF